MSFKNPQTARARSKFARVLRNKGADFRLVEYRVNFLMESADCSMQLCIFPLGRVARAGRSGTAYSLVGSDEVRINRLLQYGVSSDEYLPEKETFSAKFSAKLSQKSRL